MGGIRRPVLPSKPCTSLPQMPQALMRISNSSSAGCGTGRSCNSRCLYSERTSAFMQYPLLSGLQPDLSFYSPGRGALLLNAAQQKDVGRYADDQINCGNAKCPCERLVGSE